MITIAFGLCCIGFLLLCLSLKKHYGQVFGDTTRWAGRRDGLRISGYLLVGLSLVPCIVLRGAWIGTVLWVSMWALAASVLALLLSYKPRFSPLFGVFGAVLIIAEMIR